VLTGYLHPDYARSFSEFGEPKELSRCGGWIVKRPIPETPYIDAMGCWPLFLCQDWSKLHMDLEDLGSELVSLALVTDPFGEYEPEYLSRCFRDMAIPFKEHYVADLTRPIDAIVSKNHRYQARKALKQVQVECCEEPVQFLEDWLVLYSTLIQRHSLRGFRAFSREAFNKQLRIPGMIMLRATREGRTVGAMLAFQQGEIAYAHLAASSKMGYEAGAAYALYWCTIQHYMKTARWLTIGSAAGISSGSGDGLDFFKRGWSTGTKTAYFCGRILDQKKYAQILKQRLISETTYFPAYRQGEFG